MFAQYLTCGKRSIFSSIPFWDILCKWNHTMCGFLYPISFTWHDVFKVYPVAACNSCWLWLNSILHHGFNTFCLPIHQLIDIWIIPVIVTRDAMNICVQVCVFNIFFFWHIVWNWISGSSLSLSFLLFKIGCEMIFHHIWFALL